VNIEGRLALLEGNRDNLEKEIESSYNLADQVSASLDIIAIGIAIFTIFGGILSVFNITRSKELEEAISKAEKAEENQKELVGARLLQEGLVYVSRHRPYYAFKAFEKVIQKAPDTVAALTARYEIFSLYADTKNSEIDLFRFLKVREKFDELLTALTEAGGRIDSDVYQHLRGDAYFALGCFYGEYASTLPFGTNYINAAEWHFKMALKDNNADADYHRNLAYTYAMAGKKDRCRKEIEFAIDCAEREPLYKIQVSRTRLEALFNPIRETLPDDIQKMLNEILMTP